MTHTHNHTQSNQIGRQCAVRLVTTQTVPDGLHYLSDIAQ